MGIHNIYLPDLFSGFDEKVAFPHYQQSVAVTRNYQTPTTIGTSENQKQRWGLHSFALL